MKIKTTDKGDTTYTQTVLLKGSEQIVKIEKNTQMFLFFFNTQI